MNNKYVVTFVVLHYLTILDTIECVDSILTTVGSNCFIVIVDNGSHNNSHEKISQYYESNLRVSVIKSDENLGFARGNNLGYAYAKKEIGSDFIILLNNDTIINQKNFIEVMIQLYEKNLFSVLGPDIVSKVDGHHQNPYPANEISIKHIRSIVKKTRLLLFMNYVGMDLPFLKIREFLKGKNKQCSTLHLYSKINTRIHGSCLIFSPIYVTVKEGLNANTFMYREEDILYYECIKEGHKIMYSPLLSIQHKEDAATNALFAKKNNKRKFQYKNEIDSLNVLISLMKRK